MSYIHSFPPIAQSNAKILILGSMPGQASLDAQQYYAHPRNAFGKIVCVFMKISADLPYLERCQSLCKHHIALWDVMQSCTRSGSLDADIIEDSISPNDFHTFLYEHPHITHIFFNGAKAEQSFMKYVHPTLSQGHKTLNYQRLPSTSPAHASMTFEKKQDVWTNAISSH